MLEYRIYGVSISIFFCYVSSILCFCFLLSFGNSSSSFSLDESKTLNFSDEGRMKVSVFSTPASQPLQPGRHQGAWGRASLLPLTWLPEPLLISPQVMPPFCTSTTQFKSEAWSFYLPIFGSSPWCRVGFCLFCYVIQKKKKEYGRLR